MDLISTMVVWMFTQFWWARTVNKGDLLSWRRLKEFASSQGLNGPGRAELLQGSQLCKWCRALFLGLRRAQKRLLLFVGRRKPNPIPSPSPPHWLSPSSLLTGAPATALLRESLCWEFLPLVYSSLLRPGVCSLLSANLQTEASRALGWCHQTPASSSGRVLSQTMTSVASGHPRTS